MSEDFKQLKYLVICVCKTFGKRLTRSPKATQTLSFKEGFTLEDSRIWNSMGKFSSQNFLLMHMNLHKDKIAVLYKVIFWSVICAVKEFLTSWIIKGVNLLRRLL